MTAVFPWSSCSFDRKQCEEICTVDTRMKCKENHPILLSPASSERWLSTSFLWDSRHALLM